jgi:hypothetical protein
MAAPTTPSTDNYNNIPTGLLVPAQVPLDAKRVVLTDAILQDLGTNDNLAFTYEDGLIVYSVQSKKRWEWREVRIDETDTPLLTTAFVYPANHVIAGVTYSSKSYNFFLKREAFLLSNVGNGNPVYKSFNIVNEKHEFYTLKTDDKIRLSYPSGDQGVLLFTAPGVDNFSNIGTPIYKGYDSNQNEFQFYTLDSTDITINKDDDTGIITLSLPQTSSIPSIYINQDYVPTYDDWLKANRTAPGNNGIAVPNFQYKGDGTLARPFTNTVTYTLNSPTPLPVATVANSAITNGMTHYVGDGSRLNPERNGQKVQILASPVKGLYNYPSSENFSYTGLNLEIYGFVITNTTSKLVDMDDEDFFSSNTANFNNIKIYLGDEATLVIKGTGFWNSGHNLGGQNYSSGKIFYLLGKGIIFSDQNNIDNYIINSGITYPSYNNDGFLTFEVTCKIICSGNGLEGGQGIVQNGGKGKLEFRDGAILESGKLTAKTTVTLEAIKITGGFIRVFNSIISLQGSNNGGLNGPDRTRGIVLNKAGDLDLTVTGPQFYAVDTSFRGHASTWFDRKGDSGILFIANCSTIYFGGANLISSTGTSTPWGFNKDFRGYVSLKNNTFDNISIDTNEVDLTAGQSQAVSNIIGTSIVQSLRTFYSSEAAITAGIPKGALYIKRHAIKDFTVTRLAKLKVGDVLKIGIQGTGADLQNFSALGAPNNLEGTIFDYNGTTTFTFTTDVAELWYDELYVMT